jgi:hypothetical protein
MESIESKALFIDPCSIHGSRPEFIIYVDTAECRQEVMVAESTEQTAGAAFREVTQRAWNRAIGTGRHTWL